ncbi:MAG: PHB depolymerase family esterase [Ramlibacter sp.]|nr:PHB depolymerase family esterase [Ramlibacter sp.]
MKLQRFLLTAALAVLPMLATTTTAAVAATGQQQKTVKKSVQKTTVKKPARKSTARTAPKPKAAPPTAAARPGTDVERRLTRAGDYRFSIQHDGLARTYRLHVPARYDPAEPAPLLVALHGGGMDRMGDDGFDSLVRESDFHGFIAVYPDAWTAPGKGQRASWNAGNCCGDARARNVNDVGFVQQVVTHVFRQVSVDRERIYAAGVSDGGMMAYRLACDLPHLFRGVASVGGSDSTAARCAGDKPVSVLQFHARNDPRVPLASARATAVKWAELNGCSDKPRLVLEKAGAYCEAWTYCRRQAAVHLCVTDTGGHSWPGAKARAGAAAPSQAISATGAMWGFLISH